MTLHHEIRTGLDGVAAAATVLSHVDGERGELVIAGERVADLAGRIRPHSTPRSRTSSWTASKCTLAFR